jgi:hypothetical protein
MTDDSQTKRKLPAATGDLSAPADPLQPANIRDPRPQRLRCCECQQEIPADAAASSEGEDYLVYFCSPTCHEAWRLGRGDSRVPLDDRGESH